MTSRVIGSPGGEHRLAFPVELRQVENSVHVRAAPSVVWREIKSVRAIAPEELSLHWAHVIGLPRPLEATLSHDNFYADRWTDFIMSDLQSAIMDVIRKRCEREAR